MGSVIGIDMGGTKCAVILADVENGNITFKNKVSFATGIDMQPQEVLEKITAAIKNMNASFGAIGISCGGPLDPKTGTVMCPPNLPLWDNIKVTDYFTNIFGVPAFLQNDADACALAEWQFGAGKGSQNMLFMTFGTGLGAGLILDGRLYTGTNSMAGELGHIRLAEFGPSGYGKFGSFEGFCSGRGVAQIGYTLGMAAYQKGEKPPFFDPNDMEFCTAKKISEAAKNGDKTAIAVYEKCGEYLGRGLSIIIDLLNPEKIVIGSVFARAHDLIWPSAEKVINAETLERSRSVCQVVPAGLGEQIGDYAAVAIAVYNGGIK